ncbi:unnamed protein product, partial [Prorocentrum cordatum]
SQTLRTEQQPSALPHGGARPQAPVAPHSTRPQRARAAAWRSGPAWPGRAPRAASRSAAGRADDGRNAAAPVRGAAGVYGRVAFELSAGVPASAARAPGLERETAPSSGEARRLRRRAGSHVDSKDRRLGHRQSGNCRPQQRAGKADVRHAHGPGSTALELCGGEASTERHGVRPPPIRLSRRWQWRTLSPPLKGRANWRRRGPPG